MMLSSNAQVSRELSEQLQQLSERCGVSLHATLLTAWMLLLSRHAEEVEVFHLFSPFLRRFGGKLEQKRGKREVFG